MKYRSVLGAAAVLSAEALTHNNLVRECLFLENDETF